MKTKTKKKFINILFSIFTLFMMFGGTVLADDVSDLNFCAANGVKLALQIIGYAIFVVKIVIPIVLIVYGTIDIAKAVIDAKDGLQKNLIQFAKHSIAAILIFMAPGLINGIFNLVIDGYQTSTNTSGKNGYKDCFTCLFNPSHCSVKKYGE